jgi:alpha-glucosidase
VFGGPAWERVADGQWYLHLFDVTQPDLDWDRPEVRAEFEDILRFWLDRGVAGFRVDVANGLVKASGLPEWTPAPAGKDVNDQVGHSGPMWDQDGVHEIYRSWRRVLDSYPGDRVMVGEAWVPSAERLARYIRADEMQQAFNFVYLLANWTAAEQRGVIDSSIAGVSAVGAVATWVLSNHDVVRHASRLGFPTGYNSRGGIGVDDPQPDRALGLKRARAASMLMLALPGSAYVYQGEELGLPEDTQLPDEAREDPTWERSGHTVRGRDGCRVPIPWKAAAPSFGFGPFDKSWLPQPALWSDYAVDREEGLPDSTLHLYRQSLRLRRRHALGSGSLAWRPETRGDVLAFDNGDVTVVTNFGAAGVPLPAGDVILTSGELAAGGLLGQDTTAWVLRG